MEVKEVLKGIGLDKSECSHSADGGPCSSEKTIEKIAEFLEEKKEIIQGKEEKEKYDITSSTELLPTAKTEEAKIIRTAAKILGCDSESCVLTNPEVKRVIGSDVISKELAVNFKEPGPRDNNSWLSNVNIDKTLHKWVLEFEDLFVYPFCMSDFYKTRGSLATIKITDILEGKASQKTPTGTVTRKCSRMACVLNTDVSTGRGIHWVCIFVDTTTNPISIEYWNSAGNPPFLSATRWMEETRGMLLKYLNSQVEVYNVTSVPHQESDSECGVYSLYYIRKRLEGTPIQFFMDKKIPDAAMTEFRKFLFR